MIRPRQTILFQGEAIQGRPPEAITRKGVALVPEGRDILPSLSVEENLQFFARLFGHDAAERRRRWAARNAARPKAARSRRGSANPRRTCARSR